MKHNFKEFKEYIRGKRAAVVGIGVSNTPLIKMLVNLGAEVTACDRKTDLEGAGPELEKLGVGLCLGEDYLCGVRGNDIVFRTPSLRPDNEYLTAAKKEGAYITSEMEQFLKYCPAKVFGITGSDGKTTTTTLVSEILKKQGHHVFLGGNIGNPLFNVIEDIKGDDYAVVELSSFQLMDCCYSPDIAAITNLSPNHLDIHKSMDEYINSKKNIFLHQGKDGLLVLNKDNEITYSMRKDTSSEVRMFSIRSNDTFSRLEGDYLTVNGERVCRINEVVLPGMYNIENILTAFTIVYDYASIESMRKVATSFAGVEHRNEFVRTVDGVRYYNNSIASSPTRTVAGLNAFKQKVILIAGGYDKKIPFDELAEGGFDKIKVLIILGNTKDKIRKAFEDEMMKRNMRLEIIEAVTLEDAVFKARDAAVSGDIITLAPACASFDMFKNFEVRGNKFKEIVNNL